MLLSSTWRVGVGKGFTPPHLHVHTVVKVLSFLLILPDTLLRVSVSSKRIARIHVAHSRHTGRYVDYAMSNNLVRTPHLAYAAIHVPHYPGKQEPARINLPGGQPCVIYDCQSAFMVLAIASMQEMARGRFCL